ncbi:MAG TPA: hemerythrin domain-containing protein [Phycisphaerae bacterium]|nr:hemerythrin domain-containing protein [Phycisphaerae bacterium]
MPSPSEVARWLREQHDKIEELAASLTERVDNSPRVKVDAWLKDLKDEFERFRAHMQKHFALEEEGGYLAAVLQDRPGFHDDVQRLRDQHAEAGPLMTSIFEEVNHLEVGTPLHLLDSCARIRNLLGILKEHETTEDRLVLQAFSQDMGGND